jgi:non-ribosomal peptide synthase protein (TIGR01720 family)
LSRYADNKEFLKEKVYWSELESEIVPALQRDYEVESNLVKDTAQLSFHLTKMETHHLLTKVNNSFNTEINDILLTALGLGIKKTFGINSIPIALEGHGREKIFKDIDVNRTFGWFTIVYHIILNFSNAHRLPRQIKDIKETLRQVPNKGIGFGILKYLTSTEFKKGIDFKLKPQICFNYLGQFDLDLGQLSFAQTEMSIDNSIGSDESRKYDFDISGSIENGRLVMRISYGRQQYKIETIEKLRKNYEAELKRIISYCLTGDEKKFTPSDLTYGKLSIDEVEQLEKEYRFSDIYPLSPMQEVMYFHSIYNKNSTFYFEYRSFCLHGNLNIRFVEKSFNELLKRHDILRTVFIRDMSERPLQIVLKERNVAFYYEDISKQEGKDDFLRNFKENDKKRLFDLGKDVLMRIAVLKTASSGYEFIWSHHHILMDGWCMGILLTEFFDIYTSFAAGREPGLPKVKQYREYINWLESRDREVSRKYWRDYLYDYKQTAGLPGNHREECVRKYRQEEVAFQISREEKEELERLSAANNVTFSTLLQTIWGILLSKYNNCKDVVFGAVVSGRPAEIVGVESIVGLFINTIPVRIRYEEDTKFTGLLKKVQAGALASEPHHHYQLADIQADSALKEKLINHNITFENYPISKQIAGLVVGSIEKNSEFAFEISGLEILEQNNFDFSFIIIPHDGLHGKFWFNSFVFDRDFVREIADTFCEMIKQINKNPEIKISRIKTLSDDVHRREIAQFTDDLENE